jgi:hypothetical protein
MICLEKNAALVVTDSGGVQKEAFFYRVPCVTVREETEWTELVEHGFNRLAEADPERIAEAADAFENAGLDWGRPLRRWDRIPENIEVTVCFTRMKSRDAMTEIHSGGGYSC